MTYFDRLSELTARFSQCYSDWAKRYDLTLNELRFLYHLGTHFKTTPSEIGLKWSLPKQTVTSLCKQLDKKGWLQFLPDESDKRGKIIRLTSSGEQFVQPLIAQLHHIEQQTETDFSKEDLKQLIRLFEQLQERFIKNLEP